MKQLDPQGATDAQLLLRYQEGRDQRAFAELVRRHGPMVFATAQRALGHREDAEDAFQATFLALAKAAGRLGRKEGVGGWLYRTARKCAAEVRRRNARWSRKAEQMKTRMAQGELDADAVGGQPSEGIEKREVREVLDEELARLPAKIRAALVLCDLEGLKQKEAARQLGVRVSALNERVAKGRTLLRNRLVRRGVAVSVSAMLGHLAASVASSSEVTTGPFIAQITGKATLYAAGRSAAEIGVSSTVIETANKVITAMTKSKISAVCLITLALVTSTGSVGGIVGATMSTARAGTLFLDTFDDGDHADGMPVTWSLAPFSRGSVDASSGDLLLARNANTNPVLGIGLGVLDVTQAGTSIRSQLRVTETGGAALIGTRNPNVDTTGGYFAGVGFLPESGGSIVFSGRADASGPQGSTFFTAADGQGPAALLPYDVRQTDTVLQLDTFGSEIRVWAWRAEDSMPVEPQFLVSDDTWSEPGFVSVSLFPDQSPQGPGTSQGIFRYVHVADVPIHQIPEPAAATLASLGFAIAAFGVWRRRS